MTRQLVAEHALRTCLVLPRIANNHSSFFDRRYQEDVSIAQHLLLHPSDRSMKEFIQTSVLGTSFDKVHLVAWIMRLTTGVVGILRILAKSKIIQIPCYVQASWSHWSWPWGQRGIRIPQTGEY